MPQPQESVPMTEIHVLMHVFMLIAAIHRHTLMIFNIEGSTTYLTTYNDVTESMLNFYTTPIKFIHTTLHVAEFFPRSSANQGTPRMLRKLKVNYHLHNSPPITRCP